MPTVPTYDRLQVAPQPMATPRASIEAFGGGDAQAPPMGGAIAHTALTIYQDERRRADQIAVLGAATKASNLETDLSVKARARSGVDAFSAHEDVTRSWDAGMADIERGLTTDDQKLAFANVRQKHWRELNATVQHHVANQMAVVDEQTSTAHLNAEANAALHNYDNPDRVALAIDNVRAGISDYGTRNGVPADVILQQQAEAESKIHVGVIERMLTNVGDADTPRAASAYFAAHQGEILDQQATRIDSLINRKTDEGEAQQRADSIVAQQATLSGALRAAAQITSPTQRKIAEERIRQSFRDHETQKRMDNEQQQSTATDIVTKTGNYYAIPISVRAALSSNQNESLLQLANNLKNPKKVTKREVKALLINEASLNPDKFVGRDLLKEFGDGLNDADLSMLQNRQATIRTQRSKAADKTAAKAADRAKVDALMRGATPVPGGPIRYPGQPRPPAGDGGSRPSGPHVPDEWLDEAQMNPDYQAYLDDHGVNSDG